ncbi:MAG TPA: hypothetical protein DCL44_08870 [Elusimicrobia bacterium]|nr:hypothetical protein [Elusimicrobiota bacterium]
MKICPVCKKESASDTECLHCGIYFAKWEAIHGGTQADSVQTGEQLSAPAAATLNPEGTEKRSSMPLAVIAALALAGTVWFSQRGSSEKEIRQTFAVFHEAISAGNISRIKDMVSGQYAGEFAEAGAEMKLKMVQAFQPADIKIMDIQVKGSDAIVTMQGAKDGEYVTGTTMMVKEKGEWRVSREQWEFNMTAAAQPVTPEISAPDPAAAFPAQAAMETEAVPALGEHLMPSKPNSASAYPNGMHSPTDKEFVASFKTMPIPELLTALKTEQFSIYEIFDALLARGERTQTVNTLNEMLRDKRDNKSASATAKKFLKKAGAPVTFDWYMDSWGQPPEDKYSLMEWEIEMRGNSIVTSGKVYIGREIADGFTRPQKNDFRAPTYARYEFTVTGPGLAKPVVKVFDALPRAGTQPWNGIMLASGLTAGEYKVAIYINAQTVQANGTPLSLNHNPPPLHVEKD